MTSGVWGMDMYNQALKALALPPPFIKPSELDRVELLVGVGGPSGSRSEGKKNRARKGTGRGNKSKKNKGKAGTAAEANVQTFWTQVEDYFRDVQESDVQVLAPRPVVSQDLQLAIPLLGRSYREVWQEEDAHQQRSMSAAQHRQSATVAKQKLLSASPVSKAKKRTTAETSTAPLVTSVLSPLEDENDEPCDVCYEGDSDELNAIIFCDGCDVAVHQNCYKVATVPQGDDPWFCLSCSAPDSSALSCVLCPIKKGALKPLAAEGAPTSAAQSGATGQHAHLFCAQWVPETYIREEDGAVMNAAGVLKDRYKLSCVICKVKQGVCIQCSHGQCAVAFHPLCARANKLRMEIASREDSEEVELHAFCAKHSKERPPCILDLNPPTDPLEVQAALPSTPPHPSPCMLGQVEQQVAARTAPDAQQSSQAPVCETRAATVEHSRKGGLERGEAAVIQEGLAGADNTEEHEGRPLQLRGGAPDEEGEEEEDGVAQGALLGSLAQQYATDSEEGGDDDDEVNEEYARQGEAEGRGTGAGALEEEALSSGALNTFELAVLAPEERQYLSPTDQAKVDTLLACLDSTVLIELAKCVMAQLNITQTALAHMAQMSQSVLSYWLGGHNRPSQEAINVKMRAFLRSYCVATEVPPTDADDDDQPPSTFSQNGPLPYYDVDGYYQHPAYGLQEQQAANMGGGTGVHGEVNGAMLEGAYEAASEGSELLHHLTARTAASTGRALHHNTAPGGLGPTDEAGPAADQSGEEQVRCRQRAEQAIASKDLGWVAEEQLRGGFHGGDVLGTEPVGTARGGARKASRSQRKRGISTVGGVGAGVRAGSRPSDSDSMLHSNGDAVGPQQQELQAAAMRNQGSKGGAAHPARPDPSTPGALAVTGAAAPNAAAPEPTATPKAITAQGRAGGETPGSSSRARGAVRAGASRAAAVSAGGGLASGQKRGPTPKLSGPEEVHQYTMELAAGSRAIRMQKHAQGSEPQAGGEVGQDGTSSRVGLLELRDGNVEGIDFSEEGVVRRVDGESSLPWQAAQLAAARPLLVQAPEDEVVGELYAAQAGLLAQLASNATRSARLLQRLLPSLPAQLRAARVRAEQAGLVDVYLAAEKEAKKHDRKLRKDKEAQAVLAAATAAAAASPRNTHLRKEGSFTGTPGPSPGASDRAATPVMAPSSGPMVSQQMDLARAAAAGAAGVSSAKPPKAPGSGPRSGGHAKVLARHKGESRGDGQLGRAASRAPGTAPGAGACAEERSGRGRSVRPSLPDEWPWAESGEGLCAVCGQGESAAPNEVVFCEQCGVAVHQECYGVRVIPAGPWWCQPCAYNRQRLGPSAPPLSAALGEPPGRGHPGVRCALCPGRTGALKRAMAAGPDAAPQWVHVFCAQWMPGTNPGKGEGALVEGLESLGPDRANARCSLCGSKLGACLTCSAGRCSHKFHASCARNGGLAMSLQSTPDGRLLYHQFCEQHSAHPPAAPAKEAAVFPPDKEQELVKLKIIRVEFERVRMICDRVVRREKLKRERVRTLRELGAVQLALVYQAGTMAGETQPDGGAEPRSKRQKKTKERDEPGGGPANGPALGEQDHASLPEPDETLVGQHVGAPRTNMHQKKRHAAGELGGDYKRQRASTLARERMMTSMEASQNNCKLPAGFSYVPIADLAPDGRPLQSWGRREDGHMQGNHAGTSRHH